MKDAGSRLRVDPEHLRAMVRLDDLGFATTAELSPLEGALGQERPLAALALGMELQRPGYNVYVMGEYRTGRLSLVTRHLHALAARRPAPCDWLYAYNFEDARRPLVLSLPAGGGCALLRDLEALVESLLATFPAAFDSPSYQRARNGIERRYNQRFDAAVAGVERHALAQGVVVYRDGDSLSFAPTVDGKVLEEAVVAGMAEAEREALHRKMSALEDYLAEAMAELPQWKRRSNEELRQLHRDTIDRVLRPLLHPLRERYAEHPAVLEYLEAAREDLCRTAVEQLRAEGRDDAARRTFLQERYVPLLLVARDPQRGAPVVHEPHPDYGNLCGRIEYTAEQGVLSTHYRLISPGALHRANGGYLILEAERLYAEPEVWPALKRALQSGEIRMEIPGLAEAQPPMAALEPAPIPLSVKVVLVGPRELYYLLQELDEEFDEWFRVLADFEDDLPRSIASQREYARLLRALADGAGIGPLSVGAVGALIEYSCRAAEHQDRLSARIGDLAPLLAEAEHLRANSGMELITAQHVTGALEMREERGGRLSREVLSQMLDGTLLIDTTGSAVGCINGLAVLSVGQTHFGMPTRISATACPGTEGVVDIEREAELGLAIHSKGVMILSGYLSQKYARGFPLAMEARIALEQSYGSIDGDSAALAELCALLSALSGVPLDQSFAVTGSVNQYGAVQAVGGVNEKIEGFYALCAARGLSGKQGVIIPRANRPNLMLKPRVIEAVRAGRFAVYAVSSVDEAIGVLTGLSAGATDGEGNYPPDSVNGRTVARLRQMWTASHQP